MIIRIPKLNNNQYISYFMCAIFSFSLIMLTFNSVVRSIIPETYYADTVLVYLIYLVFLCKALKICVKNMRYYYWMLLLLIPVLVVFTCRNNAVMGKILLSYFPSCILAFICGISIINTKKTWNILNKFSIIIICLLLMNILCFNNIGSHALGYASLFPALIYMVEIVFFDGRVFFSVIGCIVPLLLAIHSDTSGALASFFLTFLLTFIMKYKKHHMGVIMVIILSLELIRQIINNASLIAMELARQLSMFNINVNLLYEIGYNGITTDRFRDSIYDFCISYIHNHIFWGSGIGNDRVLISNNTLVFEQDLMGNYPHNIFLELLMQYGLIIGGIIILYIMYKLSSFLYFEKDKYSIKIFSVLMGMGFFPLLYSSSYIENPLFFLLLGYTLNRVAISGKQNRNIYKKVL